ncbi:hypothetical protein PAAG_04240 [Paracoccidioides lutzii Pb01]|uniref:Uncharacterized protein n=1 Tax=Paracoccidioides lutzii (strain ATCC MYA-826 / Pb01) TaxID=502779 RepID=C1H0E6_PARBA|nr:hypothetical protein PAAG_04240 [Paracoccidioides lutzii Pb01]EEH33187.1 hypothetical protein PAAG_04240 [Paracoccidioides lutzii Pb01]
MADTSTQIQAGGTTSTPLTFEEIDDLIYSARLGDVDSLRTDITNLSQKYGCTASDILQCAIDLEDESEGGTGACLLHWPAANGNIETLNYLLSLLPTPQPTQTPTETSQSSQRPTNSIINHRNNSGNTPLHWAALNSHLECVKALVNAGADIAAKNNAGHDAVFLAERSELAALPADDEDVDEGGGEKRGDGESIVNCVTAIEGNGEADEGRPVSQGMQVVEWLLGCEEGKGLERGVAINEVGDS